MPSELPGLIRPEGLPQEVGAAMSTRAGGVSRAPWQSLNLGFLSADDPQAVAENRRRFAAALEGARPVFLRQVHGVRVVQVGAADAGEGAERPEADAAWTAEPGVACCVLVADCMPVLLACPEGRAVAAAHAGWRGLAGGVLEATLHVLAEAAGCPPAAIHVWLGPCIGRRQFEVGADVLQAFGADPRRPGARFVPRPRADGQLRWLADLHGLAEDRLRVAGLHRVTRGAGCTVEDASRFFSYRRDGVTGRMAAAVWRRG